MLAGMIMLGGAFSLAVDAGSIYLTQRRLQDAVDVAALKAVPDRQNAAALVQSVMAENVSAGIVGDAVTVTEGRYPPTGYTLDQVAGLTPAQRFETGAADPNALHLSAEGTAPLFLARLFYSGDVSVSASATAFNRPLTQVTAGTGALSIDADQAAVNDTLLSGLLGTPVGLSVLSYQGLVGADVPLFAFLDALAAVVGTPAGDYEALLAAAVTYQEAIDALVAAVQADPDLAGSSATLVAALNALRGQVGSVGPFNLADSIALDSMAPEQAVGARINLYGLLRALAGAANAGNDTLYAVDVPISGGGVTITISMMQPERVSAVGGEGISVTTAQMRLHVEIDPAQALNLLGNTIDVRLPLYVEVARGTATVDTIACPGPDAADSQVGVTGQVGAVTARITDVSVPNLHQAAAPATQPVEIASLAGLVQVIGSAETTLAGTTQALTFTAPFDEDNVQRVSLASPYQSVTTDLVGGLDLDVQVLGLLLDASTVTSQLLPILDDIAGPVDALMGDLLQALGIDLGYMDVGIPYVRCSNPVLAQ